MKVATIDELKKKGFKERFEVGRGISEGPGLYHKSATYISFQCYLTKGAK